MIPRTDYRIQLREVTDPVLKSQTRGYVKKNLKIRRHQKRTP